MVKKWIQKAIRSKKGVLHRQLGVNPKEKIPMSLLNKIVAAKAGQTIKNPTSVGKRKIKVTRLIEERAILARNLKKIKR